MDNSEQCRRFEADLDALLEGREVPVNQPGEYAELVAFGGALAAAELGAGAHKEAVKERITNHTSARGAARGLTGRKLAGGVAFAAALALVIGIGFAPSSFASGILDRIISTVTLGHITVYQVDSPSDEASTSLPEVLQGKVFTKDGKPVHEVNSHTGTLYTADGEEIAGFTNNEIITKAQADAEVKEGILTLTDPEALSQHTAFQVKMPEFLPKGYAFNRAEQYLDEQGTASPKYISLYFAKSGTGNEIYIQQRMADEETAYASSTEGAVKQTQIGGVDAVIVNGNSIAWETDGVMFDLVAKGLEESELIRIAESLK
ncbi:MAG: DUF4367 domain-containing protein [Paenibacillaceae bacterium]|uniref:DUF4367 domain-containing protein n=1 Tax=Paenibacillus mellifer TaxID=2937794 RepID=A0A9X2BNX3_9BACL|nr:DUF4367 domain-containing protein [Paenibacillus mellifer]MBW4839438.1 DUF4367 domain-containing protein [Paenibacillaceae bacterium]MCK8487339.1 DUF4367 domain-containing protein [Paenibacillus mellifer]